MGEYAALPGGDLVEAGLLDMARGVVSVPALLVASFGPRLERLGVRVPEHLEADPEHRLYRLLADEHGDGAHRRYNALVRRMVAFARALACGN